MARRASRGFTIVEMLISMTIMGIVMALAVVEFAMVFNHNTLMNQNLTADQNARIAMAKVTNEIRQAMPNETDFSSNYPVVVSPTPPPPSMAPGPSMSIEFWRVHKGAGGLDSGATAAPVPTNTNLEPVPCYDDVTLSYNSLAKTITRTAVLKNNANCPTASTVTDTIARNVTSFNVSALDATTLQIDLQTRASGGAYGAYDLSTQIALGYKP